MGSCWRILFVLFNFGFSHKKFCCFKKSVLETKNQIEQTVYLSWYFVRFKSYPDHNPLFFCVYIFFILFHFWRNYGLPRSNAMPRSPSGNRVITMFNFLKQDSTYARLAQVVPPVVREEERQHRICRFVGPNEVEFDDLPRFGPLYSKDESKILKDYKEEAWKHVLVKTGGDCSETTESYLSAVGDVEREAIDCYVDLTMVESETEFRWMMVKDGCFLIQLVILILGGSSVLGYANDHVIFGTSERKDMKRWFKSLFYVGNQIPLVVLWKLMEQPFFQNLLAATEWEEPSDLLKRLLYELLIVPYTPKRNYSCLITSPTALQGPIFSRTSRLPIQRSFDLLHILHSFVIGSKKKPTETKMQDIDLELGDGEYAVDDKEFLSATKLSQAGIRFKNVKGMGCRGVYFEKRILNSVLFMPTLIVDGNTELMFKCLKSYEMTQQPSRWKQEVCSYLKLMSELVQTPEDVKLLASEGIITGDPMYKDILPQMLSKLAQCESSKKFLHLRLQINEYSQPTWVKYKEILSIAFALTVLQTVFSILSYTHDVKS